MSDNVDVTPGSGVKVAADDVDGVMFQKVKVDVGGDGASVPLVRGQAAKTGSLSVVLASDQDPVAAVGKTALVPVTLSLDTSAYTSGDLMADTQVVSNVLRINDGTGILQSVTVYDEDDQGAGFDLVVLSANNSLGTENAAPTISDANARAILGIVNVSAADFIDLGGVRIATKLNIGLPVAAVSGGKELCIATIARGAPTYTAAGVRLLLGVLQD